MDWQHAIDVTLKAMTALCGMGLAGLAVVRITPRGRWKMIGAEIGPLFDPKHAKTARTVAWVFSVLVMVMMLRSGGRL
jgi:hypothetical protein